MDKPLPVGRPCASSLGWQRFGWRIPDGDDVNVLRDIRVVEVIDHSTPVSIADGSQPSRQITQHGHETGWPRWSPDGKWLVYPSHVNDRPKARIYVVGMDQETGTVTRPQQEVPLGGAVF